MNAEAPARRASENSSSQKTGISRKSYALVALAVLLGVAYVAREKILWSMGQMLVRVEPPSKADFIVVLGGDWRGNRMMKAAELVREGYAPRVLVSGVASMYGQSESDLAVEYAVQRGAPREVFLASHNNALSTGDEVRSDVAELRRLGVRRLLLVTSDFHTRRARGVFMRVAPEMEIHTIGAPDRYWDGGFWWKNREGRKTWLFEAMKSVADWFRI